MHLLVDVELRDRLDIGFPLVHILSVDHVDLGLHVYARVSNHHLLNHNVLVLGQVNSYHWTFVSQDVDRLVLVSWFYLYPRSSDHYIARVHSFAQFNHCARFCQSQCLLQILALACFLI